MDKTEELLEAEISALLNRRHPRPGDYFADTLARDRLIIAPGTYNARGARTASEISTRRMREGKPCKFNAVYFGGWSVSAMNWWLPDMGHHDRTMMSLMARYAVAAASPLPVIVDAETGFGSAVTLTQTVELFHQIGIGLAHLEDQDESHTRRCGNLGGKQCVEPEVMVSKIRSWLAATWALGSSMKLMVRTDALTATGGGIDNALERAKRYMSVEFKGLRPMVLWADAMIGREQIEKWVTEMRKFDPKIILGLNYSPNKDWAKYYKEKYNDRPPTYEELYDNGRGFSVIWHTILQARIDAEATWNGFEEMAEKGAECLWNLHKRQRKHPLGDSQAMSNAPVWQRYEKMVGGDAAKERYEKSEGYKG